MFNILMFLVFAGLLVITSNVQSQINTVVNTEEEFEKRFYEAVWKINSSNHSWVEKALFRYKSDCYSYWDNHDAIAMLELLEEEAELRNNPDIRLLVNKFCYAS